jgi:hypothetical protein
MVIRRFGVWSVARLSAALYGGLGLIFGVLVALISLAGAGLASMAKDSGAPAAGLMSAMFGVGAIILLPLLYGIMGLIFGALTAGLYNLFAGIVGGVEVQLDQ